MSRRIAVLDYGSGNLHSVSRALAHVGGDVLVTSDPEVVDRGDALLIPGVGHFGQCMRALRERRLDAAIERFTTSPRWVLGVCIGMQILFDGSEEDAEPGLGLVEGTIRRFPAGVTAPHMGWNTVSFPLPHAFHAGLDGEYFYFVHSYAAFDRVGVGVTDYGAPFAAAIATQRIYATQFHPEKSGEAGLQFYENLVKAVTAS